MASHDNSALGFWNKSGYGSDLVICAKIKHIFVHNRGNTENKADIVK